MSKKERKRKPWMRKRHRIVRNIIFVLLYPYVRLRYGIQIQRFKAQGSHPYLILYNHQTPFDQFFIGMSFRGAVYYVATEDIFSNGFISSLIRYLVAPIPIKKQATDVSAVMNCFRVAREGGTIAIAPEGNRTYSGKTEHMSPTIAPLAKKLGLPIAFFRIEGGYGAQPRWSDVIRKGPMRAYVSRVVEPEELAAMSTDELFSLIESELSVNEACADARYPHKKSAEYLERLLYVCPDCGLSTFESRGCEVRCTTCGKATRYLATKELEGVGFTLPFRFVNDWYEYQKAYVRSLKTDELLQTPLFCDTARMTEVIVHKKKHILRPCATLTLYGDRVEIDEGTEDACTLAFCDVSAMAICGKNKLNIYHNGHLYQFKGNKRFNAIKYVNIYYQYKAEREGNSHGEFLGL